MIKDKNLKYLISYIKDFDFILFNNDKKILYKDVIPLSCKIDLDILCDNYYPLKLSIRKTKKRTSFYRRRTKTIFLNGDFIRPIDICFMFSHELAHHIQYECEMGRKYNYTFNEILLFERQAERLAYFIYKKYFSHLLSIHHLNFNSYRSKEDIDFLYKYHFKNGSKQ